MNTSRGKYDIDIEYREGSFMPVLWCFVNAFLTMAICTRSSLLYAFNLWDDANSYFTVGKCIFRGFVPYRDLFDQKGILLYFIYGLASLISPTTFTGVFIFEIIAAGMALLAIFKIYQLYLKTRVFPYIMTPITGAVIYTARNFYWGGSAEEFLFPFLMWGLYLSLRYFKCIYPKPMDTKTVFIGGILAGCVFNIKFNSLGLFFAWMMMAFFAYFLGEKQVAMAFAECVVFIVGMLLSLFPWIVYFGVNGAIDDWMYVYVYKNAFEYSKKLTLSERFQTFYDIVKDHFLNNKVIFILIAIGIAYFLISAISTAIYEFGGNTARRDKVFVRIHLIELINLGLLFGFLLLLIFIGGVSLPYYSFPINGFVVFGIIPFCYIIERNTRFEDLNRFIITLSAVSALIAVIMCWFLSINVRVMNLKKDELWLYKFRDYIAESGVADPGLIVEFSFDVGLYTVLNIEPICYYFQTQTLNMQEVLDYQKQYLHSGEADFVVTVDMEAEGTGDRYDLVMQERCQFYEYDHTYYLYQRNQNPVTPPEEEEDGGT